MLKLYQRAHRERDGRIASISRDALPLGTAHYGVSEALQIDSEWAADGNALGVAGSSSFKLLTLPTPTRPAVDHHEAAVVSADSPSVVSSSATPSDVASSASSSSLSLGSISYPSRCPKPAALSSPFRPCIDKIREMSSARTPSRKPECLVDVQRVLIKCIDRHRRREPLGDEKETESVGGDDGDDDDEAMSIESLDFGHRSAENKVAMTRSHGIVSDDDGDDEEENGVSLISYESIASEFWTPSSSQLPPSKSKGDGDPKCKQLLVGADDILPLFCYILVQSQIGCVSAEMAFMGDFMSDEEKQKKAGFYLTTLQAAASALIAEKLPVALER